MIYKDYKEYLKQQIVRAESKWGRKGKDEQDFIKNLIETIKRSRVNPNSICCMGCRSGTEVFIFKEMFPDAEVYGVDITENIHTIKTHLDVHIEIQDFNNLPAEWEDKFDLVFSNSIDHAYDPVKTFKEWTRVTKPGGHLLLEFSTTPENNIEHSFADIHRFKPVDKWETPERNIITGLFNV